MAAMKTLLLLLAAAVSLASGRRDGLPAESRLYQDLMSLVDDLDPDRALRPVADPAENVTVHFGLSLIYFNGFEEDSDVASFSLWEKYTWKDANLKWEPYEAISTLRIPIAKIWRPDIRLFNKIDARSDYVDEEVLAVVSADGSVLYIPRVARRVHCTREEDLYVCGLKFGSWTYDAQQVDLQLYGGEAKMDVTDFVPNRQFSLESNTAARHVKKYDCCPEEYVDVTFTLKFAAEKKNSWTSWWM